MHNINFAKMCRLSALAKIYIVTGVLIIALSDMRRGNKMLGIFLIILGIIVFFYEVKFGFGLLLLIAAVYVLYCWFCGKAG